mmetsp:Transcript_95080/g.168854  ORF Transcript_95080/g.168854 Transcript_95080/m.168854 type:complete len:86 (-) Transcript_95080:410-667(-)
MYRSSQTRCDIFLFGERVGNTQLHRICLIYLARANPDLQRYLWTALAATSAQSAEQSPATSDTVPAWALYTPKSAQDAAEAKAPS